MLTNKKQALAGLYAAPVFAAALLCGCSPSGPEALMEGRQHLDRGQPVRAVRSFREATLLMPTNALAWGYLGLAYQQGGFVTNAVTSYSTALSLSPDSAEIRFNLGCLWMSEGQWGQAREQFAAATVLRKDFAMAWQGLGEAQVRLREFVSAVKNLGEALRLDADSPDAWNWLGVAQLEQGRAGEAKRSFESALRLRANHGPALLNLAILNQTTLKQPEQALVIYQQYLAFLPNAANASEVREVVRALKASTGPEPSPTVVSRGAQQETPASRPPETSGLTARAVVRTNRVLSAQPATKPTPTDTRHSAPDRGSVQESMPEIVRVNPAPTIASSSQPPDLVELPIGSDQGSPMVASTASADAPSGRAPSPEVASGSTKRGFFSKINPLNLFKKNPKKKQPTPSSPEAETGRAGEAGVGAEVALPEVAVRVDSSGQPVRYSYPLRARPAQGDTRAAVAAFDKGLTMSKRGRQSDALEAYHAAVQFDPSFFEAQFNLGSLYLERGDPIRALPAFEAATKIQPESAAARYNFALTLRSAGYPVDSATELLRLLERNPNDVRAHLALGNLYAQQFGDRAQARREYQRVLQLSPGHPQASSIHLWLVQNPL